MDDANRLRVPPYKIKTIEEIRLISRGEREKKLKEAGYNPFQLKSKDIFIDLLTDSGTGAMSDHQWAALVTGDESYAGSRSFSRLEQTVKTITGYKYVMPAHQGRGAEKIVLPELIKREGMLVLSNTHFDTTRAHVEIAGGRAVDVVCPECFDIGTNHPFKGNFDIERLTTIITSKGKENIAAIIATITNNSAGGEPVSYANMKAVAEIAKQHGIPVVIDGARYAENAYFVKHREQGMRDKSVRAIAKMFFDLADVFLMSAKKDGLVNIGGLIAIKDDEKLYQICRTNLVPMEGFPTYGGMAGRDMEALAVGLDEALDETYLAHRIKQVNFLGDLLDEAHIPIQKPTGGHAVFVDCGKMCPHIPFDQFPAQAVCNELYLEGGIRAVEIGSLLLGRDPDTGENNKAEAEFMRLTIPRRVYTDRHLEYVADCLKRVYERRDAIKGLEFVYESPILRHFTAKLKPVN